MPSVAMLTNPVRFVAVVLGAVWLAGCALVPIQPGSTRADVLAKYGQPSAEVAMPSGSRLQYSYQPAGQSALMVDLDASGRVASVKEALTLKEFSKIGLDTWTPGHLDTRGPAARLRSPGRSEPGRVLARRCDGLPLAGRHDPDVLLGAPGRWPRGAAHEPGL